RMPDFRCLRSVKFATTSFPTAMLGRLQQEKSKWLSFSVLMLTASLPGAERSDRSLCNSGCLPEFPVRVGRSSPDTHEPIQRGDCNLLCTSQAIAAGRPKSHARLLFPSRPV